MDLSRLKLLRQVEVAKPCGEDWNAMAGDDRRRFCGGCGCFVHNLSGMAASEAEELLATPDRVCTRMTVDARRGILTRDGWVPRLLLAGVMAASVAGCAEEITGEASSPLQTSVSASPVMGKVREPNMVMGEKTVSPPPKAKAKPKDSRSQVSLGRRVP